jgi:hypothetical protein
MMFHNNNGNNGKSTVVRTKQTKRVATSRSKLFCTVFSRLEFGSCNPQVFKPRPSQKAIGNQYLVTFKARASVCVMSVRARWNELSVGVEVVGFRKDWSKGSKEEEEEEV